MKSIIKPLIILICLITTSIPIDLLGFGSFFFSEGEGPELSKIPFI